MTTPDLSDPEIMKHIKAVQDNTERWCAFGYVPKSNNKIKFYESGTGGLDELREELSDSSIRYAYIRYQINNMPKYCYIAYCGDGVNGPIKGSFAGHAIEIAKIMKPVHHQLNARNEDDVDEKAIIAALTRATGANYDSGAKNQGVRGSVALPQSVAQGRVQATQSNAQTKAIDKSDYNKKDESSDYWKKNSVAADKQQQQPAKPDRSDYNITTEREEYWKQQRQQAPTTTTTTRAPAPAPSRTVANRFQESTQKPVEQPSVKPPPPKVTSKFSQQKPVAFVAAPEPEPEPVYEEPQQHYEEQQQYEEPQQQYEEQQQYDDSQQQYEEQQQYDDQQQQYDDQQQQHYDDSQQQYDDQQQYDQQQYDDSQQQYDDQSGYDQQAAGGIQVRALYDYQGENEGDLSFAAGDIINILDQSDPSGWWQGEVNGYTGYFPRNFVEEM